VAGFACRVAAPEVGFCWEFGQSGQLDEERPPLRSGKFSMPFAFDLVRKD
jgi:hypothetical protein